MGSGRSPDTPHRPGFELLFRSLAFACLQDQEMKLKLQPLNAANFGCRNDFHVIKPRASARPVTDR